MQAMKIAVYGASGHTAGFVLAELARRGHTPIAVGRDNAKMPEMRVAPLDDAEALDRALAGADAVINCAGPFLDTAAPLIQAALRLRVHYFDLTAEQRQCAFDISSDSMRRPASATSSSFPPPDFTAASAISRQRTQCTAGRAPIGSISRLR